MTFAFETAGQACKPDFQRQTVHDLRNLFAIVASAKQLLERGPGEARRRSLLDALEDAASRGDRLTTRLLANGRSVSDAGPVDPGLRLANLSPMMQALRSVTIELDAEISVPNSMLRIDGDDFDAVIMELVANAVTAGARTIRIRSKTVGSRIWILVRDDGCGMSAMQIAEGRRGVDRRAAHGTGLSRVNQFVRSCHGKIQIRARQGAGTCVTLILPGLLTNARFGLRGDRSLTGGMDPRTVGSHSLAA